MIRISEETKNSLVARKITDKESFDSVIKRLLWTSKYTVPQETIELVIGKKPSKIENEAMNNILSEYHEFVKDGIFYSHYWYHEDGKSLGAGGGKCLDSITMFDARKEILRKLVDFEVRRMSGEEKHKP